MPSNSLRPALCAGFLLACAVPALGGNMLVNPGFETGDLTGWPHSAFQGSIAPSTAQTHGGGFSVKFSSVNSASLAMSQDVAPTLVSQIREVSLWYKRTGNPNASPAGIRLLYTDGSFTDTTTDAAANNWTYLDLTTLLAPGKLLQSMQISAAGQGQSVYFDDVTVNLVPAPAGGLVGVVALGLAGRRRRR
jgi:hypothetical protein